MTTELNANNKVEQVQVEPLITYSPNKIAKAIYEAQATIEAIYNGVTLIDWDERLASENEIEVNIVTKLILIYLSNKKITSLIVFTTSQEALNHIFVENQFKLPFEFAGKDITDNATIYAALFNSIMTNLICHNSNNH